jgi:hypothetical protein
MNSRASLTRIEFHVIQAAHGALPPEHRVIDNNDHECVQNISLRRRTLARNALGGILICAAALVVQIEHAAAGEDWRANAVFFGIS